jgi:hypothetical protein
VSGKRVSYLSVSQFHALDLACSRLREAFDHPPYLVGSVQERPDWRDVDVRMMLNNDEYEALTHDQWTMYGLAVSAWLSSLTGGLPIDFQFQQRTAANEKHDGKRNPLGTRDLRNFRGDGRHECDLPVGALGRMTRWECETCGRVWAVTPRGWVRESTSQDTESPAVIPVGHQESCRKRYFPHEDCTCDTESPEGPA